MKALGTTVKMVMVVSAALLLPAACGGDDEPGNGGDGDADGDSDSDADVCDEGDQSGVCAAGPVTSLVLTDNHNYTFNSDLNVTSVEVKSIPAPDLQNLTFDWSQLTHSFLDENVMPTTDIGMLVISAWNLSPQALEDAINNDKLFADVRFGAICNETGGMVTQDDLLTADICLGEPVSGRIPEVAGYFDGSNAAYDPTLITHMAMVKSGTNLDGDLNVKMIKFFTLNPNSQNTMVTLDNNSASLVWDVDLMTQARVPVAVGNPAVTLNWENVYYNGLGNAFNPNLITRVVVAHYPMNVCQLENSFLHLETVHDGWYEKTFTDVTREINLTELTDGMGNPFPGITANGTWIVGLFCGTCGNPAPWFLTILQPC